MTSQIDPSKPATGMAFTSDMRANFYAAYNEISSLQQAVEDLGGGIDLSDIQAQIDALKADVDKLKAQRMVATSILTADPPNTSSAVYVTAGIGVQFTPVFSTRAIIEAAGLIGNTQNGQITEMQLIYGQGTSPTFGTLVSVTNGQFVGGVISMMAAKNADYTPFSMSVLLENLVINSLYWFGVGFRAQGGAATLSQMSLVGVGLLDPIT